MDVEEVQMEQSEEQHFQRATSLLKLALSGNIDMRQVDTNNEFYNDSSNNSAVSGKDVVKLRCKEIRIKEIRDSIEVFMQLCQHFNVYLEEIEQCLHVSSDIDPMKIFEIWEPVDVSKLSNDEPVPAALELSRVIGILQQLKKLSESVVFLNMWIKEGEKEVSMKKEPLTVDEVIENVWRNCHQSWVSLGRKMSSEHITFKEFHELFGNIPNDNLLQQLMYLPMTDKNDWVHVRIRQYQCFRTLHQYVHRAKLILDISICYDLRGNFQPIKIIEEMSRNTDRKLCDFDSSLMDVCDVLRGIRDEQAKCLEVFVDCKCLVDYLRKSMQSLMEFKVFVDLACLSAGERDMEVERIKCLHAATTGYAPLIFNLGDKCDYSRLLEQCELVWKNLKADPDLHFELINTKRELKWLNSFKYSTDPFLELAKAINSTGIYIVGKIDGDVKKEKLTLDDVLGLIVQSEEFRSRRSRSSMYKYEELQRLLTRFLPIDPNAKMGNDDAARFTTVFDAVVRLCNVYLKLVSSRCVLFLNWEAKFVCDPDRTVCAFIKFGSGDRCTQLKGRRYEDVSTIIYRLTKSMEMYLEEWLKYIDHNRDEYQHLNFFTVDQMVILQKELVLMGGEDEPSDLIYPLLSIVKHDCTKMDLIGAMERANSDVSQKDNEQEVEIEDNVEEVEIEDNEGEVEIEDNEGEEGNMGSEKEENVNARAIEKFTTEIVNLGYTEKMAKQALKTGINPVEIDEDHVFTSFIAVYPDTRLTNVRFGNGLEPDTFNSVYFKCLIVFKISDVLPVSTVFILESAIFVNIVLIVCKCCVIPIVLYSGMCSN